MLGLGLPPRPPAPPLVQTAPDPGAPAAGRAVDGGAGIGCSRRLVSEETESQRPGIPLLSGSIAVHTFSLTSTITHFITENKQNVWLKVNILQGGDLSVWVDGGPPPQLGPGSHEYGGPPGSPREDEGQSRAGWSSAGGVLTSEETTPTEDGTSCREQ